MTIRICQLITELVPAGAERVVYELATRLDRGRFDVQVAALRGGQMARQLEAAGVKVTVLGVRGRWDAGKLLPLARLLRRERIDILHTHLFHADLAGRLAARFARVPHVVNTVHVAEARFRPWQFLFDRLAARPGGRIVCVSNSVQRFHSQRTHLPPSRYTVIPNGIDPAAYRRDDSLRAQWRQKLGVADTDVLAAFAGRLDRQKGVDTLLEAWRVLHSRGLIVPLVIAGQGPQWSLVEQFSKEPAGGAIRFIGFTPEVRGVLSAADMLVMPSRWEGFGLAAAEAMAAGLPVVASRVAGLDEVVEDGRTGTLIPPEDPAALADAVAALVADADLRRKLGAAGVERVAGRFAIERNIQAHEKLYMEIAGA